MPELNDHDLDNLFRKAGHCVPRTNLADRIMARVAVTPLVRSTEVKPLIGKRTWLVIALCAFALVGVLMTHRHNEQRLRVRPRFLGGRSSGARYDTPRELVLVGHRCIRMPADAGRYGPGARTAERGAQELTRSSKLLTA
jgi:hypothetical protein